MNQVRQLSSHPLFLLMLALLVMPFLTSALGSTTGLATQVAIYTLYSIAFNLLLGYTGLVSFGSSMFFGTGTYVAALTALHVTQNVFLGLFFATAFAALLSVAVGALILRRSGIYFALLSLAFTQLFYEIAIRWVDVTGGENGLQGVLRTYFQGAEAFYAFTAVVVFVAVALLLRFVHSPFGRVLQVIRDNERRARCLGYNPMYYKLGAFVVSSSFIGLAGGLLAFLIHGAYANNLYWQHAGDPVLMAVLGGMHHFLGPLWGAILFINLEDQLSAVTEHWWLFFGALMVVVVLLSPEGLSGIYTRLRGNFHWGLTRNTVPPRPDQLPPLYTGEASTSAEPVLSVRGLKKSFGHVVTADGIDVAFRVGEIHSVIGPNGAGKTTFFNMLTGLLSADAGHVVFNGRDITDLPTHKRAMLGLARSFQIVSVPANLTVFEAVRVAVQAHTSGRSSIWRDAYRLEGVCEQTWALLHMIGLDKVAEEITENLPHGEQRLLDIAVALAGRPVVLLLDEPLAGLADAERERISALLRQLAGRYTIVLIEHDIDRVVELSDSITVLHEGRVIADGTPDSVVNTPAVMEAYLGQETEEGESEAGGTTIVSTAQRERGPLLLNVSDMAAGYGGSQILEGLNLAVHEGETVALLGRNGVGKTTTLHSLMGTVEPSAGRIQFQGTDITNLPPHRINQLGLSIVPQGRRIFPNLSVNENLLLARRPGGWEVEAAYDLFPKLKQLRSSQGENLSGGELQMLAIARALMAPTNLILLDEPLEGLAPAIVEEVMGALLKLRERTSILLVEQRVEIALRMADRVYVMVNGHIAFEGAPDELLKNKELQVRLLGV